MTWQAAPAELAEDGALAEAVLAAYAGLTRDLFADDLAVNPALTLEVRSLRRIEDWRVALVLTPWMLARLWFPDAPPELALPPAWTTALGPVCAFTAGGIAWKGHFGHHPQLGHHLIQPLMMNLAGYDSADAVFAAWDQVIRTRDANMARAKRDCAMQAHVSRHELLARVFRRR